MSKQFVVINWFTGKSESFTEEELHSYHQTIGLDKMVKELLESDSTDYTKLKQRTATEIMLENSSTCEPIAKPKKPAKIKE